MIVSLLLSIRFKINIEKAKKKKGQSTFENVGSILVQIVLKDIGNEFALIRQQKFFNEQSKPVASFYYTIYDIIYGHSGKVRICYSYCFS